MDIFEAIRRRQTYRLDFQDRGIASKDLERILEAFRWAPSPHTIQSGEVLVITERELIEHIADLTALAARMAYSDEQYWQGTYSWLRFSREEFEQNADGVLVDQVPVPWRPFLRRILSPHGVRLLQRMGVTGRLADENYGDLVRRSPLLLAIVQDRRKRAPGQRGGLWNILGLGAAMENVWLAATALRIGCQPITLPLEYRETQAKINQLLSIPDSFQLLLLLRLGYIDPQAKPPAIAIATRLRRVWQVWTHENYFTGEDTSPALVKKPLSAAKPKPQPVDWRSRLLPLLAGEILFLLLLPGFFVWLGRTVERVLSLPWPQLFNDVVWLLALPSGLFLMFWATVTRWADADAAMLLSAPNQHHVANGPYRYCRSPLLLGTILYYLGLCTYLVSPLAGAMAAIFTLIFGTLFGKLGEEKIMSGLAGEEYLEYRRKVPFLFPRFWIYFQQHWLKNLPRFIRGIFPERDVPNKMNHAANPDEEEKGVND